MLILLQFQAEPCIEVSELDASSGTKELLQPIYELQCSIKEIEEFGKTAFYEHEVVNTDILDRLQETMKKLQNKLIESVFMGCETKHTFDTELERLNKEKEKLKREMVLTCLTTQLKIQKHFMIIILVHFHYGKFLFPILDLKIKNTYFSIMSISL